MAYDLLFGKNSRNWSRELASPVVMTDEVSVIFTEAEKDRLSKITILKMKSEAGDKTAKKQMILMIKDVAKLKAKAKKGDAAAKRALLVLRESGLFNGVQKMDMSGSVSPNDEKIRVLIALRKLKEKNPKTAEETRQVEQLTERLARLDAMSGSFVGRSSRGSKRARRMRRLQDLKTKAAAGNPNAIAKLRRMQDLYASALPATALPTIAPTIPGQAPVSPSYTPTGTPTYYQPAPTVYPTYPAAYQSPYFNPDLAQNPYGPAPQPTIDVYQGEEEAALAGDGGSSERQAVARCNGRSFIGGPQVSNTLYRATVQKQAIKHAGGKRPTTKDIFLAKAAVDKAIGKAGITLFMPGSKPGRRTI
jgi:hypothetical protein